MLKDNNFKFRYTTGRASTPIDFFETALSNSTNLDLGLGYFSSASFNILSTGIAHFICNDGCMRLYINENLTEDDYNLLKDNKNFDFEESILSSYKELKSVLSHRDEHFFKCLSYLIQNKRIDIKIVVMKDGGIAHEKFGVFTDSCNDKVSFTGSMNMTASALTRNLETIECVCSWKSEDNLERISEYENDFNEIWEERNKNTMVFPAKKFCNEIVSSYPKVEKDHLIKEENEIIKSIHSKKRKNEVEENPLLDFGKNVSRNPHFPDKYNSPLPYQVEAYENWLKNNQQGIFAMATGTGKTITSLNCALEEYKKTGSYEIIILVPTLPLVDQWEEEVGFFDFHNITKVSSKNPDWKKDLLDLRNKLRRGKKENFVIITTYDSFVGKDFQDIMIQLKSENIIIIADEAHNVGQRSVLEVFKNVKVKKRIALSATPKRVYDEEGSKELEELFNDSYPYVYNFPMSKAIEQKRLMDYMYYPRIVTLEEDEMSKYVSLTKRIIQVMGTNSEEANRLLMLRKQILHKAQGKILALKDIVGEIGEEKLKYCFVFAPEGKSNQEDDSILNEMLNAIHDVYPHKPCNIYTGELSKNDRANILSGFEDGKIDVLLAMKCLDEGVNIPRAEYGIFASSTGNPRQFIQRRGRLLRLHPDKEFARIYDMIVVPDFKSSSYSKDFFKTEKSLVREELSRVAYFANLAVNKLEAKQILGDIADFYELNLSELILSITQ